MDFDARIRLVSQPSILAGPRTAPRARVLTRRALRAAIVAVAALSTGLAGCAATGGSDRLDLTAWEAPANAVWLDSLDVSLARQDWGQPQACRSVDGNILTLAGRQYLHGLGTHANGRFDVELNGQAQCFVALAGVDDESGTSGSVRFVVVLDEREVVRTDVMRGGAPPRQLSVDLSSARRLSLRVEDAGDGNGNDHADWAGALIEMVPAATTPPRAVEPK